MPCCCLGVETGTEFQFWGELNDFSFWQHEEFHEPRLDLSLPAQQPASSDWRDVTREVELKVKVQGLRVGSVSAPTCRQNKCRHL